MSTHHAATALRYLDESGSELELADAAIVHAELEIASQIERLADAAKAIDEGLAVAVNGFSEFLEKIFPVILAMISSGNFSFKAPFDPNQN